MIINIGSQASSKVNPHVMGLAVLERALQCPISG
jgi:hypothetical protein